MSTCPGLNLVINDRQQDMSQPVEASFNQSEEGFYGNYITITLSILDDGKWVLYAISEDPDFIRLRSKQSSETENMSFYKTFGLEHLKNKMDNYILIVSVIIHQNKEG